MVRRSGMAIFKLNVLIPLTEIRCLVNTQRKKKRWTRPWLRGDRRSTCTFLYECRPDGLNDAPRKSDVEGGDQIIGRACFFVDPRPLHATPSQRDASHSACWIGRRRSIDGSTPQRRVIEQPLGVGSGLSRLRLDSESSHLPCSASTAGFCQKRTLSKRQVAFEK